MKTALKALVLLLVAMPAMMLSSCSDVDDGSYVDPIKLTEKVTGQWALSEITQTDEVTGQNQALTNVLGFDGFAINLGSNGSFSVEGDAPALLPENGTWKLDNDFTKSTNDATMLLLDGGNATAAVSVSKVPTGDYVMGLKLTRTVGGTPIVSYTYTLTERNAPAPEGGEETTE